jgi:hypothetical protein
MTSKGDAPDTIRDVDILAATGPYLFTELYHSGRKVGRYTDVYHMAGTDDAPVLANRHGGPDWHKFGPYCEHMLSHTWTKPEEEVSTTSTERHLEGINGTTVNATASTNSAYTTAGTGGAAMGVLTGMAGLLGFALL